VSGRCDPAVVGGLAVLQSALPAMPMPHGVASLVAAGVARVPGVAGASLAIEPEPREAPEPSSDVYRFRLDTPRRCYGRLDVRVSDRAALEPYEPYLWNLANAIALHAEGVEQRRRLEDLARENADLYEKARAAVRAREHLIAVVSHDLRSPLAAVSLGLDLLERAVRQLPGGEAPARRFAPMHAAVDQMKRLVTDLLDFDRLQHGHLPIGRAPTALSPLLAECVDVLRPIAETKGVSLSCTGAPDIEIDCDRGRILQALANVVGNAVKFTPSGGSVDLVACADEAELRLTVRDTGPGIAPEFLPRVFEQYAQQDRSDARGVGLGLAIAKGIVEAHGGTIGVASALGRGTSVTFTLPRLAGVSGHRDPPKLDSTS
jgi:signal transduction histidine kinase